MEFPSEMLVDYVRVYQRKGHTNIGCDPPDYPTSDYINRHPDTYGSKSHSFFVLSASVTYSSSLDPNFTTFNYPVPKNGLVSTPPLCSSSETPKLTFIFALRSTRAAARSPVYFTTCHGPWTFLTRLHNCTPRIVPYRM
jgi:hypothetical protein